jgi:CBS domain-containing protein
MRCQGASNNNAAPSSRLQYEPKNYDKVSDAMSSTYLYSCQPDDTVDSALEKLVQYRITGLPVVDEDFKVVGVVSDYDLLALDKLGSVKNDKQLFPQADETWQAFKEVKRLLAKSSGRKVSDVMTATPITVHPETSLDEAATLLLSKKIHRLPVVDEQGKLIGVLSRGNLVKAALAVRKAAAQQAQ